MTLKRGQVGEQVSRSLLDIAALQVADVHSLETRGKEDVTISHSLRVEGAGHFLDGGRNRYAETVPQFGHIVNAKGNPGHRSYMRASRAKKKLAKYGGIRYERP